MKIGTNSHVNQVRVVFFKQDFSNKKIYFASLIFKQIHITFIFTKSFLKRVWRLSSKKLTD